MYKIHACNYQFKQGSTFLHCNFVICVPAKYLVFITVTVVCSFDINIFKIHIIRKTFINRSFFLDIKWHDFQTLFHCILVHVSYTTYTIIEQCSFFQVVVMQNPVTGNPQALSVSWGHFSIMLSLMIL